MADFSNDELYAPCPCGSGKKLKFCCRDSLNRRSPLAEEQAVDDAVDAMNDCRFEDVIARLQPLVDGGATSPTLHTIFAEARFAVGDTDGAIARLRDVVERWAPGDRYASAVLAHVLLLTGQRSEAVRVVDRLMASRPRRTTDVLALGGGAPSSATSAAPSAATSASASAATTTTTTEAAAGDHWQLATVALPQLGTQLPLLAIVVDVPSGRVLAAHLHERIEHALAATIALGRALGETATRPTRLEVTDDALVAAVAAVVPGVAVTTAACAEARAAMESALTALMAHAEAGAVDAASETWAARGVPLELARRFHEAAATLYRARPWDVVPDDGCAFVLTSDDGLLRGCTVVVIGQARQSFGVLIHEDIDGWRRARRAERDREPAALPPRTAVEFNTGEGVPPPLLAEIRRHKLPLAGPAAVPWLMAFGEGAAFALATAEDAQRAALVLRTLTALLAAPAAAAQWSRWRTQEPLPTRVVVDDGAVQVAFTTAVD